MNEIPMGMEPYSICRFRTQDSLSIIFHPRTLIKINRLKGTGNDHTWDFWVYPIQFLYGHLKKRDYFLAQTLYWSLAHVR